MCETKMHGGGEYDFCCTTHGDNKLRTQKFIAYLREWFTYGQRVVVAAHYATCEYLVAALGLEDSSFHFAFAYISATMVEYFPDGLCPQRCLNA